MYERCAEVCMYHHERYDGDGYPLGLKGDEIPIAAQIVGVADAYDAGDCGVFNPRLIDLFSMMRMELEEVHEEIMRKKG